MTTALLLFALLLAAATLRRAVVLERENRGGAWLWIAISAACVLTVTTPRPPLAGLGLLVVTLAMVFHCMPGANARDGARGQMTAVVPQQRSRAAGRRGRRPRRRRR